MKKSYILLLSLLVSLVASCSDDGFIKVFKCTETYPYFNANDNRCYKSDEAARKAEEVEMESISALEADADALDANRDTGNETGI